MIGAMIVHHVLSRPRLDMFAWETQLSTPPDQTNFSVPTVELPVMLVAEVEDSLLVVVHDLVRLDGLLAHIMENLMQRFTTASANLSHPALAAVEELDAVRGALHAA